VCLVHKRRLAKAEPGRKYAVYYNAPHGPASKLSGTKKARSTPASALWGSSTQRGEKDFCAAGDRRRAGCRTWSDSQFAVLEVANGSGLDVFRLC
jgi:hypothetical protein